MKENPYPIAPEGIPFILISLCITIGLGYFFNLWAALAGFLAFCFCIWFFRDPKRITPNESNPDKGESVISPADGTIIAIEEAEEPRILKEPLKKVSIFMSPLNVHVNRSPVSGKVIQTDYFPGKFVNASFDKASLQNEANALLMETLKGAKVVCVQIAGFIARRIVCYAKVGDQMNCGQRMGIIRFGSRVDIYLPKNAQVHVGLKQKVCGGETLLAVLPSPVEKENN